MHNKTQKNGGSRAPSRSRTPLITKASRRKTPAASRRKTPAAPKPSPPPKEGSRVAVGLYSKKIEKHFAIQVLAVDENVYALYSNIAKNDVAQGDSGEYIDHAINFKTSKTNILMMADFGRLYDSIISDSQIILIIYRYASLGNSRQFKWITEIDITGLWELLYGKKFDEVKTMYDAMIGEWKKHTKTSLLGGDNIPKKTQMITLRIQWLVREINSTIKNNGGIMKLQWKLSHQNNRFQGSLSEKELIQNLKNSDNEWKIISNKDPLVNNSSVLKNMFVK